MSQSGKNKVHTEILENIDKYGLTVRYVFDNKQNFQFSYSIGLYKAYRHPEIIMIGLKQELMHVVINNLADDIKNGKRYEAYSLSPDVLDGFECYFIEVDKSNYDAYVGVDLWLYDGDDFPLLQCIYPTVKGIYPWEKEWPENIKNLQPILGDLKLP